MTCLLGRTSNEFDSALAAPRHCQAKNKTLLLAKNAKNRYARDEIFWWGANILILQTPHSQRQFNLSSFTVNRSSFTIAFPLRSANFGSPLTFNL